MLRIFLFLSWKDLLKQYIITSFAVFHFLSFNLRYFSLFELFVADIVTLRCMISSRLTLLYLVVQAEDQGRRQSVNWGGGGCIFIYSSSAWLVSFEIKLISKEVSRAKLEYMNIHPPPSQLAF